MLSAFASVASNRLTQPLVLGSLLESDGVSKLRTMQFSDKPPFMPLATPAVHAAGQREVLQEARQHARPLGLYAFQHGARLRPGIPPREPDPARCGEAVTMPKASALRPCTPSLTTVTPDAEESLTPVTDEIPESGEKGPLMMPIEDDTANVEEL
jgi:hypothetical protein